MTFSKTILYLLIESFDNGKYVFRKGYSMIYVFFFYFGLNLMWIIIPLFCIFHISLEFKKIIEKSKKGNIKQFEDKYMVL